jgi:two-component system nitrate/nitrite response regulator NarL
MSCSCPPIRVVVVTDVRLYRDGLEQCLQRLDGVAVVGVAARITDAIELTAAAGPDIVLLDMSMPASIAAVGRIRKASPGSEVVAFAIAGDESDVISYVEAGVTGYVPRDGSVQDLWRAIESAANGEAICSPRVAARAFRRLARLSAGRPPAPLSDLTPREREVAQLIERGMSNKQIARRLVITLATVKNHVHNVLEKLSVQRRGEVGARMRTLARRPDSGWGSATE